MTALPMAAGPPCPPSTRPAVLRARAAHWAGTLAADLSRRAGLGAGGVVGGRVALSLDPDALARLTRGRRVALVTGTNGKTTTAHLLAAALRTRGPVAHNATGANMLDGATAALMQAPGAALAVLEVDELHLPAVAAATRPEVVVLLNLSRDQLDRGAEVATVAATVRRAVAAAPSALVVANGDDPVVVATVGDHPGVHWFAGGGGWTGDVVGCLRCAGLPAAPDDGACRACVPGVPAPAWVLRDGRAHGPGTDVPLRVALPGRYNEGNALAALAAATALGADPGRAAAAMARLDTVASRYALLQRGSQQLRLLLAKNPAGWRELLPQLRSSPALLLAVNRQAADGRDTSWLWDVPFEQLPGVPTVAAGQAAADLGLRLAYADRPHTTAADPVAGLAALPPGPVTVVANYTAFAQLVRRLDRAA